MIFFQLSLRAKAFFLTNRSFCFLFSFNYAGYFGSYGFNCLFFFVVAAVTVVVDTRPQFESKEFTASEDSNVSVELTFSALNKQRRRASVSLVIVKGVCQDITLMTLTAIYFFKPYPLK